MNLKTMKIAKFTFFEVLPRLHVHHLNGRFGVNGAVYSHSHSTSFSRGLASAIIPVIRPFWDTAPQARDHVLEAVFVGLLGLSLPSNIGIFRRMRGIMHYEILLRPWGKSESEY